ncbi:DUF1697 domain-containing protein [Leptobacterium flavescens]|uniref:DUF1697 domain-containing protein n=1 Tax=Leptobacterium flavescens TaxID=472055 RepID=A0A6P0UJE3_9FLAO|nr:DUF1697 domain-containing protein [Leptobacterium flavescens]NER13097.1 DUF1697 domain-containing protein [Leptobacterium flavescens]
MTKWIVLLRGINVSGHKLIKMALLREILEQHGFKSVKTYIQSGNIVFESEESNENRTAGHIESILLKEFGYEVPTMAIEHSSYAEVIERNPFKEHTFGEHERLYVSFLKEAPSGEAKAELQAFSNEDERFVVGKQEVYVLCNKLAKKLNYSNTFIEKKLKTRATTRNWNTVNKIYQL